MPGVTSISCDPHKYGFAPKGSSILMFSSPSLRHAMYTLVTDWTGGIYATPTILGSRPGGVIAATWAALRTHGVGGYVETTRRIVSATKVLPTRMCSHARSSSPSTSPLHSPSSSLLSLLHLIPSTQLTLSLPLSLPLALLTLTILFMSLSLCSPTHTFLLPSHSLPLSVPLFLYFDLSLAAFPSLSLPPSPSPSICPSISLSLHPSPCHPPPSPVLPQAISAAIQEIDGIDVIGRADACVVSFKVSDNSSLNIYSLCDAMRELRGWDIATLQSPPAAHLALTLPSSKNASQFARDLKDTVGVLREDMSGK